MNRRILCVGETWLGSDARAAFLAFRRLGHSVHIIDEWHFVPLLWRGFFPRLVRRSLRGRLVRELERECIGALQSYSPDIVFVFKGNWVSPEFIQYCRSRRVPVVNYYPDVSFMVHGPYIPACLPLYDHVFTTKSYGLADMKEKLGVTQASFLAPGFDPELHRPIELFERDKQQYDCDICFIGTWSPKKETLLASVCQAHPSLKTRIWGCQWEKSTEPSIQGSIQGREITGDEYTKAICASKIVLGLLSEQRPGASSGDLITARTFQIPACGAFMLHEFNPEAAAFFEPGTDAAFFGNHQELNLRISYYLGNQEERQRIASSGRNRSIQSGYSIDCRMSEILSWLESR